MLSQHTRTKSVWALHASTANEHVVIVAAARDAKKLSLEKQTPHERAIAIFHSNEGAPQILIQTSFSSSSAYCILDVNSRQRGKPFNLQFASGEEAIQYWCSCNQICVVGSIQSVIWFSFTTHQSQKFNVGTAVKWLGWLELANGNVESVWDDLNGGGCWIWNNGMQQQQAAGSQWRWWEHKKGAPIGAKSVKFIDRASTAIIACENSIQVWIKQTLQSEPFLLKSVDCLLPVGWYFDSVWNGNTHALVFHRTRNELVNEEKRIVYRSENADITAVLRLQDDTTLAILTSNGQVDFVDLLPNSTVSTKITTTTTTTSAGLELAKAAVRNRITQVHNEALDKQHRFQDTVKVIEALEHSVSFGEEFQWPLLDNTLNNMMDGKPMLSPFVQQHDRSKRVRYNLNPVRIERAWFHGPMACIAICVICPLLCDDEEDIGLLLVPQCKSFGGKWQKLEGNRIAAWTMLDLNVVPASPPAVMQYKVDVVLNSNVIGRVQVDLNALLQPGWICLDTKLEEKPPFPLFTAEESIDLWTSASGEPLRISASSPARMLALIRQVQEENGIVTRDWKACNGLGNAQRVIDALKPNNNNDDNDDEAVAELLCLLQENDYYFDQ